MKKLRAYWYHFLLSIALFPSCRYKPAFVKNEYHYNSPQYNQTSLKITTDTLEFAFPDTLYYKVQSFNTFISDEIEYIAFFDSKELYNLKNQSIFIYNFVTHKLVTRIPITRFFANPQPSYTTVHVKNLDSIFVFNYKNVQLFDSSGVLKKTITLAKAQPQMQFYNTGNPPVFAGHKLYTGVKSPVTRINFERLEEQKVLYEFDMLHDTATLYYNLPEMYFSKYYGYLFLENSYCYNDSGRFVFSFAGDTAIYETNLNDYNNSYYGKSISHIESITSLVNGVSATFGESKKNYNGNNAYGAIYFDKFRKKYLRIALHKKNELSIKNRRPQSIIIFNEQFRIIGETSLPANIDLERIFFSEKGLMYAELLPKMSDTIRFIRLDYDEKGSEITRKK